MVNAGKLPAGRIAGGISDHHRNGLLPSKRWRSNN
jgi:hypothetical protein